MTAERWQATIATDLTGAFLVSRRFLKGRGESTDPASLIHISSIHAEVVRAGGADYCAAKGGLTKLVQTIAIEEAARGIRDNAIRPGRKNGREAGRDRVCQDGEISVVAVSFKNK